MKTQILKGIKRDKATARAIRRDGDIPAILYGDKDVIKENISFKLPKLVFEKVLDQVGEFGLVELEIDESKYNVLVKDMQKAPVRGTILHVDFVCVNMDKKVVVKLPVKYVDEAPVVKKVGGIVTPHSSFLKIECMPKDLPEKIEVSLLKLEGVTDSIKASDIDLPANVILAEDDRKLLVNVAARKVSTEKVEAGDEVKTETKDDAKEEAKKEETKK